MRNDHWYVLEREIEDGLPDKVLRGYNDYETRWKLATKKTDVQRAWSYGTWFDVWDLLTHYSEYAERMNKR